MKAAALLLLAAFALATVADGATPGAAVVVVEMSEAGPPDVPGIAEVETAAHAAVRVQTRVLAVFAEVARAPASWSAPSDVPPPEA